VCLILIHSPLVGPFTWTRVAKVLAAQSVASLLPELRDDPDAGRPYWQQHAESAAMAIRALPPGEPLVLVGHSGAGPLLPAIAQALGRLAADRRVAGYLFVDAGLPLEGRSRLASFGEGEAKLRRFLQNGGRFPNWTAADLREIIPDAGTAQTLSASLRPRGLAYWDEPIPTPKGWPGAPAGYLLFSAPYRAEAERARGWGWPVRDLPAGHFHMLVEPEAVAGAMLELAGQWLPSSRAA
jgi:hypothetical protein